MSAPKTIFFFVLCFAASAIASNSRHTNARRTWENPNGNNNTTTDVTQTHAALAFTYTANRPFGRATKYTIFHIGLLCCLLFYDYIFLLYFIHAVAPFAFEHNIILMKRSPSKQPENEPYKSTEICTGTGTLIRRRRRGVVFFFCWSLSIDRHSIYK